MSTIFRIVAHWLGALFQSSGEPANPDQMSMHDWADLPVHHPVCDRAPC